MNAVADAELTHAHARLHEAIFGEAVSERDSGAHAKRYLQVGATCVNLVQVDDALVQLLLVDGRLEGRHKSARSLQNNQLVLLEIDSRICCCCCCCSLVTPTSQQAEPLAHQLPVAHGEHERAHVQKHSTRVVHHSFDYLARHIHHILGRKRLVATCVASRGFNEVGDDASARVGQLAHLVVAHARRQQEARVVRAAEAGGARVVESAQVPGAGGQLVLELLGLAREHELAEPVVDTAGQSPHCRIQVLALLAGVGQIETGVVANARVHLGLATTAPLDLFDPLGVDGAGVDVLGERVAEQLLELCVAET